MNTTIRYLTAIFVFLISINLYSQVKDSSEFTKLDVQIEKGDFAITLNVGTIFGSSTNLISYGFVSKYHISDKNAIRFELSYAGEESKGSDNDIYSKYNNYSRHDVNVIINIQHYFTILKKIKSFFSAGPVITYTRDMAQEMSYYHNRYEWGVGLFATIGAEIFIYNKISLAGEYTASGTIGKRKNTSSFESTQESTIYRIRANSIRFGLCVYL